MVDPQDQDQLLTFDQREERACQGGRDLTAWPCSVTPTPTRRRGRTTSGSPPARSAAGPPSGSRPPEGPYRHDGSPR
jgi:hypothetical protein